MTREYVYASRRMTSDGGISYDGTYSFREKKLILAQGVDASERNLYVVAVFAIGRDYKTSSGLATRVDSVPESMHAKVESFAKKCGFSGKMNFS